MQKKTLRECADCGMGYVGTHVLYCPDCEQNRPQPKQALDYPSDKDWTEDFEHENGNYANRCLICGSTFHGHKRRVYCRECAKSPDMPR